MFRASAGEWIRPASLGEHMYPLIDNGAVRHVRKGERHPSEQPHQPDPNIGGFNVPRPPAALPRMASPAVSAETIVQVAGESFAYHCPLAGGTVRFRHGETFSASEVGCDLSREIASGLLRVVA